MNTKGRKKLLNRVSVLIPYKPDNGIRDELFKWVKTFYQNVIPEVELCIGESQSEPFNRSQAINHAAKKATRDVFVIADGDMIYDPKVLVQAIQMLNKHAWVIPFSKLLDLSESSTQKLIQSSPEWPLSIEVEYEERFNDSNYKPVSGLIVVTRKNFNRVKGFDERFVGWGKEDNAFKDAMNTICGRYKRINNHFVYHLWHARIKTKGKGNPNFKNNIELYKQYSVRRGKRKEMKKLIKERSTEVE